MKPYIDSENRLHLFVLCDGTGSFLSGLINSIKRLECTGIESDGRVVSEGIPEDQPWCNYCYEVSGILPDRYSNVITEVDGRYFLYDLMKPTMEGIKPAPFVEITDPLNIVFPSVAICRNDWRSYKMRYFNSQSKIEKWARSPYIEN